MPRPRPALNLANRDKSEDGDEELILDQPGISQPLAKKVRECSSIMELLKYVSEAKPPEVKCFSCLESKELKDRMLGLSLKLNIHGYEDRGDRLSYLYSVLAQKYANKEEAFKLIVQFLMNMSERPTAVTNLRINTQLYSVEPDEDSVNDDSEKERALLEQIMKEGVPPEQLDLQYSSDSELSEWSTDEEESVEEKSTNDLPPICKVRLSSSFGEFKDLTEKKLDQKKLQAEIQAYWNAERSRASTYLYEDIRKFEVTPLTNQPVISSLLVLQARFGEFWEWKRSSKQHRPELLVAYEEDVVREILWQFIISSPDSSPVFSDNWSVKPNLIVSTLSKSSFQGIVNKFGKVLSKLQSLRGFIRTVEGTSYPKVRDVDVEGQRGPQLPSKIYRNYCSGLQEISTFITAHMSRIELELKRTCRNIEDKSEPACTTLIQLVNKTRFVFDVVNIVYEIHSKSIATPPGEIESEETEEPWYLSIKLISCIETHLSLQTKPNLYGVLLFLFSKCLYALLDDILSALKTLKWQEKYSLFIRNSTVRLNDSDFWSECIKPRKYKDRLRAAGITPLQCLDKLLPQVLNILKTCEVLDQLEEDFSKILSKSEICARDVVHEFLEQRLSASVHPSSSGNDSMTKREPEESIDFLKHFKYIGLGSSFASEAFQFLSANQDFTVAEKRSGGERITPRRFEDFHNLELIPSTAHETQLDEILTRWFNPFRFSSKENIEKIFQDYKVIESMTTFQEIVLMVREDFARAVIDIITKRRRSDKYKYEDSMNRNPKFQQLLNECYPDGRENFVVDLKIDPSNDDWAFLVTPQFPLNLIVTPKSVAGYIFIGKQLQKIRKSLWDVASLSLKDCRPSEGVHVTRLLMFRFCLINFCTSIRSFFTLKLFSKDFSEFAKSATFESDLDSIRRIHGEYLESIKTKMMSNPLIERIIIYKISKMSEILRSKWSGGMPQAAMLTLEDTLKKCWQVVNDFESTKYSFDFNELSYHFGPPPSCLL